MKVAELRQELRARGLDAKGKKTALEARMQTALEAEAAAEDVAEEAADATGGAAKDTRQMFAVQARRIAELEAEQAEHLRQLAEQAEQLDEQAEQLAAKDRRIAQLEASAKAAAAPAPGRRACLDRLPRDDVLPGILICLGTYELGALSCVGSAALRGAVCTSWRALLPPDSAAAAAALEEMHLHPTIDKRLINECNRDAIAVLKEKMLWEGKQKWKKERKREEWRLRASDISFGGDFHGCDDQADAVAALVAGACTHLKTVNLRGYGLTDAAVQALASRFTQLDSVTIDGKKKEEVRDYKLAMRLQAGGWRVAQKKPRWREEVGDAAVLALAESCRQLRSVSFCNCPRLTDEAVVALTENCGLLNSVTFDSCLMLTDAAMEALAKNCSQLSNIGVAGCVELTDVALVSLAEHCKQLSIVNFGGCTQLTDTSVVALAENCGQLSSVSITASERLTDAAVVHLAENCRLLNSVTFDSCSKLTVAAVEALVGHSDQLRSASFKDIVDEDGRRGQCVWASGRGRCREPEIWGQGALDAMHALEKRGVATSHTLEEWQCEGNGATQVSQCAHSCEVCGAKLCGDCAKRYKDAAASGEYGQHEYGAQFCDSCLDEAWQKQKYGEQSETEDY
jgi:hypothetical protein